MHNTINHILLFQASKNIPAVLHNSPYGPKNNSMCHPIRYNTHRGKPIAFTCSYLPVAYKCMWDCHCMTLCSTQTYSTVDASALLTLATTHYTPITLCLCSHWSPKHFNPSLSPRP